jgi:adenylate kinase
MSETRKNDRAAWISGSMAKCSVVPEEPPRAWRLVLLGAPGVGKGTQAEMLTERLGVCHLSTGDVFRAATKSCTGVQTAAMTEALRYMREGRLVPDTTVWEIIRERVGCIRCHGGFVLDGFPRTIVQAEALGKFMAEQQVFLDAVLDYELPTEEIVSRLSGRRVCPKCKAVFHVSQRPPRKENVCDHCGNPLMQREDDRPESIKVRLQTYEQDTAPLIDYYRKNGRLVSVSAAGSADEVFERSMVSLEAAITDGPLRSRDPREAIIGIGRPGHWTRGHSDPL